jgi:hypothetical protein
MRVCVARGKGREASDVSPTHRCRAQLNPVPTFRCIGVGGACAGRNGRRLRALVSIAARRSPGVCDHLHVRSHGGRPRVRAGTMPRLFAGLACRLLPADGLHVRVSQRDRRVRTTTPRLRGAGRAGAGRDRGHTPRPPGVAQAARGTAHASVLGQADINPELASACGSDTRKRGVPLGATFIVDSEGNIRL